MLTFAIATDTKDLHNGENDKEDGDPHSLLIVHMLDVCSDLVAGGEGGAKPEAKPEAKTGAKTDGCQEGGRRAMWMSVRQN
jgi:hypothetical protein